MYAPIVINKKEIALANNLFLWVGEGDRTLDPQDHNLIL